MGNWSGRYMVAIDERMIAGVFEIDEGNSPGRRGVYVWRVLGGVLVVLGLALPLLALWEGVWMHHWEQWSTSAQFPLSVMIFLPWAIGMGWFPWRTILTAVSRLWQAAADGGDTLAPLAETQSMPLEDVPEVREVVAPLRGINDSSRVGMYWALGILFVVLGLLLGGVSLLLGREVLVSTAASGEDGLTLVSKALVLVLVLLSLILMLLSLILLFFGTRWPLLARRLGRGMTITADDTGLTWPDTRWRSGERHIAWSETEAFITIMCKGSGQPPMRIYALKAGGTTLLWSVKGFMSSQEHTASDRLRCLIVTRTRLPLRDLTAISRVAVDELIRVSPRRGARSDAVVAQSPVTTALLDAILPHDFIGESARKARRVRWAGLWVSLPYLLLNVASAVAPWFQGKH